MILKKKINFGSKRKIKILQKVQYLKKILLIVFNSLKQTP